MAISLSDAKVLWGRAGARCCNPDCRADLTKFGSQGVVHVGEMAHLIAHSSNGPRGDGTGGNDTYENLVLLCPTCHTTIDKAPDDFPEAVLRHWKAGREKEVSTSGVAAKLESLDILKLSVRALLLQNGAIFESVGPKSKIAEIDPISDAVNIWELRKVDTIIPNNRSIIETVDANLELLRERADQTAYAKFKEHALAFEDQNLSGIRREYYPTFPNEFQEQFG